MDLSTPQVDSFVAQAAISKPIDEALRRVLAQKSVIQADVSRMAELESERDSIFDDQQRLRENIKSLTGGAEEKALLQRYTQQLNQQETRLEELRKQTAEIETKRHAEQEKLDRMIQELSFDVRL